MLAGDIIVATVVGITWLLEIIAGDIIVAAVVGIMWLLEMLPGDIIAVVVGITQLLEMLAGDIIVAVVGITLLEMLACDIMASNRLGLCMVDVVLDCKNAINLDAMLVAANVCT